VYQYRIVRDSKADEYLIERRTYTPEISEIRSEKVGLFSYDTKPFVIKPSVDIRDFLYRPYAHNMPHFHPMEPHFWARRSWRSKDYLSGYCELWAFPTIEEAQEKVDLQIEYDKIDNSYEGDWQP